MDNPKILARMRRQHGLISRSQALDEGMTGRQIERLVQAGAWEREASGVYNRESFVQDRRRRNETTLAGWTVLNFTWRDYTDHPAALCEAVAKALAAAEANFCQ